PWKDIPTGHTSTSRGHGRVEKRTLKAVTVSAGILFPHALQAILRGSEMRCGALACAPRMLVGRG
nr:hypothetical protein [Actinomycetota bacterium]